MGKMFLVTSPEAVTPVGYPSWFQKPSPIFFSLPPFFSVLETELRSAVLNSHSIIKPSLGCHSSCYLVVVGVVTCDSLPLPLSHKVSGDLEVWPP